MMMLFEVKPWFSMGLLITYIRDCSQMMSCAEGGQGGQKVIFHDEGGGGGGTVGQYRGSGPNKGVAPG